MYKQIKGKLGIKSCRSDYCHFPHTLSLLWICCSLVEAEQHQLFRSAQVIQNAFRSYKVCDGMVKASVLL